MWGWLFIGLGLIGLFVGLQPLYILVPYARDYLPSSGGGQEALDPVIRNRIAELGLSVTTIASGIVILWLARRLQVLTPLETPPMAQD